MSQEQKKMLHRPPCTYPAECDEANGDLDDEDDVDDHLDDVEQRAWTVVGDAHDDGQQTRQGHGPVQVQVGSGVHEAIREPFENLRLVQVVL